MSLNKFSKALFFCTMCHVLCTMYYVPAWAKVVEKVVAVVNQEVITRYDLDRAMAPMLAEGQQATRSPEDLAALRRQVLENLVHQKLLEQEIIKSDIEVTDSDLQRAIAGILQKNGITVELLREELSAKGISFESYKEQIRTQVRQAKFIQQNLASQVQITSQDVQNYRRQHNLPPEQNDDLLWQLLFNERLDQEIHNYVLRLRKKAYVEIRSADHES